MEIPTILGISFSTRQLGLAVFKTTLVDYSLSLYKERWSPRKRDMILASLSKSIRQHYINEIVLSIPEGFHRTKQFNELLSAILTFAILNNIPYKTYPVAGIYAQLARHPSRRTRKGLMMRLVSYFPELDSYYKKELRNRNKYYIKLFEAIGVAIQHYWELDRAKIKAR